eukprot:1137810-Pelagomonas_calceolata.AAC.1
MQAASQGNNRALFKAYSDMSTRLSRQIHLRGLLRFKRTAQSIPLEEVRARCATGRAGLRIRKECKEGDERIFLQAGALFKA